MEKYSLKEKHSDFKRLENRLEKMKEKQDEMEIKTFRRSESGLRGTNLGAVAKDHQSTDNEDKHELK